MKNRNYRGVIIETVLILLCCIFLFWLNASHIISRIKADMRKEMVEFEKETDVISDRQEKSYSNYELVQKHIARLGGYYLACIEKPDYPYALGRISEAMETEGVFIISPNKEILFSSSLGDKEALSKVLNDSANKSLYEVSADAPISDVVMAVSDAADTNKTDNNTENQPQEGEGFLPDEVGSQKGEEKNSKDTADTNNETVTYCSCYLDSGRIFVACDNYADYASSANASEDVIGYLDRARYGKNGFYCLVDSDGGVMMPRDLRSQKDKISAEKGVISKEKIKDGFSGILSIRGKKYFCSIKKYKDYDRFLLCALSLEDLIYVFCFISLPCVAAVLIALLLMRYYVRFLKLESSGKGDKPADYRRLRNRLSVLTFLCICAAAAINIYVLTLYISSFSLSQDVQKTDDLQQSIATLDEIQAYGSGQYKKTITIFTQTAAAFVTDIPAFDNWESLKELSQMLGVDHVLVYDGTGKVTASDENYTGITLSDNPKDLSYEFRWVLRRFKLLIQDQIDDRYLDEPYLFSGLTLKDEEGGYVGMVQLAIAPSFRDTMVEATSRNSILSSFANAEDEISLAVNRETKTVYSSYEYLNGLKAKELGLTDNELKDEYTGYFTIQGQEMTGCCKASGDYWVIVASSTEANPLQGVRSGILSALPGIFLELAFFVFLLLEVKNGWLAYKDIEHELPGKKEKEESWAESRLLGVARSAAIVCAGIISLVAFASRVLFEKGSVWYYIFVYPWSRSFNIFTLNKSIIILASVAFSLFLVLYLLELLASLLSSRQETVIRLFLSFIKYFGVIGAVYYCLTLLGVPNISLLASAGVLTAVLSFGAQNIVADILAGLFIIFEGSFKVGDMITVDDWHGEVMEIGVRNTTIHDLSNNDIKILNNSTIKKVVNFSAYPSYCTTLIGVEYGIDLKELEAIIDREAAVIKKNMGDRIGMFVYLGVDEFADSAMILKFRVTCRNQDFPTVRRALNREIKMMFDRNGIQVPFPQIVLHEGK